MKINKKGQFQISFGMIFSMFLIVIFLVVAFVVIKHFLDLGKEVEERQLVKELNDEVRRLSESTTSATNKVFTGDLGDTKVTYVCFFNSQKTQKGAFVAQYEDFTWQEPDKETNFYFYPREKSYTDSAVINYVNMTEFDSNPYCKVVKEGKVEFRLSKDIGEFLVRIS